MAKLRTAWAVFRRVKPSWLVLQGKATIVRNDQHDWLREMNRRVNEQLRTNDRPAQGD